MTTVGYVPVGVEATFEHRWVTKSELLGGLGESGWEAVCLDGKKILVKRRLRRMGVVITETDRPQTGGNI